jgi:hypothetical protein
MKVYFQELAAVVGERNDRLGGKLSAIIEFELLAY